MAEKKKKKTRLVRRARVKIDRKFEIDDKIFQDEVLKNTKVIVAGTPRIKRITNAMKRALKADFEARVRFGKKRGGWHIATQDEDAPFREAATGAGAKVVKRYKGRLTDGEK